MPPALFWGLGFILWAASYAQVRAYLPLAESGRDAVGQTLFVASIFLLMHGLQVRAGKQTFLMASRIVICAVAIGIMIWAHRSLDTRWIEHIARLLARCSLTGIALWSMSAQLQRRSEQMLFGVVIIMSLPIIAAALLVIRATLVPGAGAAIEGFVVPLHIVAIITGVMFGLTALAASAMDIIEDYREESVRMALLRAQRDATLGFLSHDMRSPAISILALLDAKPKNLRERRIAEHAKRALTLAEQFVQGAHAEEAPLTLERIDLATTIDEAVDYCWETARRAGSRIEVTVEDMNLQLDADRSLLSRALVNLIENALKYGPASSVISVRAWRCDSQALVSVSDSGAGLSAQQVDHIFKPFDRAGLSDERGVGLGLALVETVARRHGGDVRCFSQPGAGTEFVIQLPAAD